MLFTGWEVRIAKYCVEVSKTAEAEGRGTFLRPRQNIFLSGPTKTVNNVFIFLSKTQRQMATVLLDCAYRKQNNKEFLIFNYFTLENKQFN